MYTPSQFSLISYALVHSRTAAVTASQQLTLTAKHHTEAGTAKMLTSSKFQDFRKLQICMRAATADSHTEFSCSDGAC